ncbi:MAG: hypothetical protein ACKVKG_07170 [Alphaproteobacteria bacterium]|jgi:hypothetical protein
MTSSISQIVEMAKAATMTDAQREEQRRSFVFGNTAFENANISREIVDSEADKLESQGKN